MKSIGRDASLDEPSVSNAERLAAEWRRPTQRRPRLVPAPVTTVTVHPAVMAAAKAAMRPGQRLVIESATTVRIVNDQGA